MVVACTKDENTSVNPNPGSRGASVSTRSYVPAMFRYSGSDYSQPISVDTANRMIQSYLISINYPENNTNLRSLTFDADTLRSYLKENRIVTIKFMLAHTQDYMNSGNYGVNAGTRADAMTMVIVGLDEGNNYVKNSGNMVYDNLRPCPVHCDNVSATINY